MNDVKIHRKWTFLAWMALLILCSSNAYSQRDVSGVVTDSNGEVVIGATIIAKESLGVGTITDFDGVYQLSVSGDVTTLVFSYLGYDTQEVVLGENSIINVVMQSSTVEMEELQVVAYGTQKKVTVTGAISSINSDELGRSPSASITNSLAGKVTGLSSVQYTGEPGADEAALYIRGVATLNDARPLVVVDGVERDMSQLDPEEVASISILKDASATAMYGIKGANGVIIVTTKRGEKGKMRVSFNAQVGLQEPTRLLEKSDSYTYAMAYNERQLYDGTPAADLLFTPEVIDIFKSGGNLVYPDIDWYDVTMNEVAPQMKYSVSMSGGNDILQYYVNLGYLNQGGLFKTLEIDEYSSNFNFQRFNYRANFDINVTPSTKMKINVGGRTDSRNSPLTSDGGIWEQITQAQAFAGAGVVDGLWITSSHDTPVIGEITDMKDPLKAYYGKGMASRNRNVMQIDLEATQKLDFITKGLSFTLKGAMNYENGRTVNRNYRYDNYYATYQTNNSGSPILDENGEKVIVIVQSEEQDNMTYGDSFSKASDWYFQVNLNYNRKFAKAHTVNALVLFNQSKEYYPRNANGSASSYQDIPRAIRSIAGRVTYDYKSKYMVSIDMAYNGSENFHPERRYGFFPAASVGWVVTEEKFMERSKNWLSFLRLRGSYGQVGNDRLGGYRFVYQPTTWNVNTSGYNFGILDPKKYPGAVQNIFGNEYVSWEVANKLNVGFDARFFDARLRLVADYFNEDRNDILIQRETVSDSYGMRLPVVNLGRVSNQGCEIELSWRDKVNKSFDYFITANGSFAHNKVLYKDEYYKEENYMYETGHPVSQPFGYVFDGFFTQEIIDAGNYPAQQGEMKPGYVMYKDLNGDNVIDHRDQKAIGYTHIPEVTFGATMGFRYKKFNFSMTWAGATNVSRQLTGSLRMPFSGLSRDVPIFMYEGRWTPETASTAKYPIFSNNGQVNNYQDSDLWTLDASYLRLKNLELSYTIASKQMTKRSKISNVVVYANGNNLLTFDSMGVIDPESKLGKSVDYPIMRIYNLGVRVNL